MIVNPSRSMKMVRKTTPSDSGRAGAAVGGAESEREWDTVKSPQNRIPRQTPRRKGGF